MQPEILCVCETKGPTLFGVIMDQGTHGRTWTKRFDPSSRLCYYQDVDTNETVWEIDSGMSPRPWTAMRSFENSLSDLFFLLHQATKYALTWLLRGPYFKEKFQFRLLSRRRLGEG